MERGRQQGQDWRKQSIQGTGKSRCKGPVVGANVGQTGKRKDAVRRLTHSVCGKSEEPGVSGGPEMRSPGVS